MSVRLLTAALDQSRARLAARLVLICLADRADDWGRCYPGKADIARRAGISRAAVTEALAELERLKEIERRYRPGRSTVYRVTLGARTDEPDTPDLDTEGGRPDSGRPPRAKGARSWPTVGQDLADGRPDPGPIIVTEPSKNLAPARDADRAAVEEWHAGMRDAPGELVAPERFVEIVREARAAAKRGESVQTRHRTGADKPDPAPEDSPK